MTPSRSSAEHDTSSDGRRESALVAITPAHNEADHLEALARSMADQTLRPAVWVIVDDRSIDGTDAIADGIAERLDFVHVLHRDELGGRALSSKAEAVAAGYEAAIGLCPDAAFVASIDADVELPPHTFALLLERMTEEPKLGITGGIYQVMVNGEPRQGRISPTHVPGPLQVFRRSVFDAVGGYRPLRDGGLDVVSTAHARMLGWETRVQPDLVFSHRRLVGTGGDRHPLVAKYHMGQRDYSLGVSFLFLLAKRAARILETPPVIGSLACLGGYLTAAISRRDREVPPEIRAFIRAEQHGRASGVFSRRS